MSSEQGSSAESPMKVTGDDEMDEEIEEDSRDNEEDVSDDGDPGENHEFEIIDQVESEEDEGEGGAEGGRKDGHSGDRKGEDGKGMDDDEYSSSSDGLDDTELHAMLEKGIDKDTIKKQEEATDGRPIIKHKIVLKEFESDPFDILPEGWVCVTHNCGMPIYLHKETRVCTMARPYSLGSASARTHNIPISAIPCLQYKKQLDKMEEGKQASEKPDEENSSKKSQVTDNMAATQGPVTEESGNGTSSVNNPVMVSPQCPTSLTESTEKTSPTAKKMWVVTQESFQKLPSESQEGALHTGTEFNTLDIRLKCGKEEGEEKSHDENIAVSFDSSTCLEDSSCIPVSNIILVGEDGDSVTEVKDIDMASDGNSTATTLPVCDTKDFISSKEATPVPDLENPVDPNTGATECEIKHENPSDNEIFGKENLNLPSPSKTTALEPNPSISSVISTQITDNSTELTTVSAIICPHTDPNTKSPVSPSPDIQTNSSDHPQASEERKRKKSGDDGSENLTSQTNGSENTTSKTSSDGNTGSNTNDDESSTIKINNDENTTNQTSEHENTGSKTNGDKAITDNNIAHVVREEGAGRSEPSEIVTSSTNPLATIKRKIQSLKNRRAEKLRKLDNGSAAAWPQENNVANSAVPFANGDASNAALNASADEKLKAHAAEVKIKSAEDRAKESLLDSATIHKYCTRLFQFRTLEVKKYKSWRERRKHLGERSRRNRPELPSSTKLITCPIPGNVKPDSTGGTVKKREFVLNPTGKSYLCILHEYMQRTLKIQPLYVFKELENSKTPYGATVTINNIEYGTGYASSKKVAKQEAAKETLKVLIPDLFNKMSDQEIKRNVSDLSFFDEVKVTDPRVNELGNKVGQPSPFQLLLECLRRNFGMGNTQCEVSTQPLKNQKCEFTINVGKHTATVVAKNKREGKQLAAQAILAKLHPHVPSWGSLLRLYGTSVEKPIQKPDEMNEIKSHAPNHSVLDSLREEMRKLHKQKEAIQSKGKIIISSKDLPSKMTGVDL